MLPRVHSYFDTCIDGGLCVCVCVVCACVSISNCLIMSICVCKSVRM